MRQDEETRPGDPGRPPVAPLSDRRPADRSYLAIAAWTIGLFGLGVLFFRYAGSGAEPEPSNASRPLVPPTPLEKPERSVSRPGVTPEQSVETRRRARLEEERRKVTVLQHKEASYLEAGVEHLAGYVKNDSAFMVTEWRATITFFDSNGKRLEDASARAKNPLPSGKMEPFVILHTRNPLAARATMTLQDVTFKK